MPVNEEPNPVVPADMDCLEPRVRAHLERHIEIVRSDLNDAQAQATLGLVYESNALWPEAVSCYRTALALNPKFHLARYHLAMALDEVKKYDQYVTELRHLVIDAPEMAVAHHRLGDALLDRGELDGAARAFVRASELMPQAAEPYAGLGDVEIRRGNHTAAIGLLEKAVQLDPGYRSAHYLLGTAYRSVGRTSDAQRELRLGADAWKQFLRDPWTAQRPQHALRRADQAQWAQTLVGAGQLDQAAKVLEDVIPWHRDDAALLSNLASVYINMGRFAQAIERLTQALKLDETETAAHINLATCFVQTGNAQAALRHADRATELSPNLAEAHQVRFQVLWSFGKFDQALTSLDTAVRLEPQDAALALELANRYLVARRPDDARRSYIESIRRNPSRIIPYLGLCESCAQLGLFDEAFEALNRADAIAPGHPKVAAARHRLEARLKTE